MTRRNRERRVSVLRERNVFLLNACGCKKRGVSSKNGSVLLVHDSRVIWLCRMICVDGLLILYI